MSNGWWVVLIVVLFIIMSTGCASKPVIETQIVKEPVPVPCRVETPSECKEAYAVDRISVRDDALTINRAMRVELEERAMCQERLLAALRGCNQGVR